MLQLFDKGVEMEVGVQTDLFVDRPATPVYVPAKTGADAFTQIYPGDVSTEHTFSSSSYSSRGRDRVSWW